MQSMRVLASMPQASIAMVRSIGTAAERLLKLPKVQITEGESPYLLLTVYIHGNTKNGRDIIRGWQVKKHDLIYKKIKADMEKLGLCIKSNGGGFINNDAEKKSIEIYGACTTHGRADHKKTRDILHSWSAFRGFKIKLTDEAKKES